MRVNPAQYPTVNDKLAQQFVDWLLSVATQNKIAAFTQDGAHPFLPASAAWQAAHPAD
jgi:ABC-type tungstate transport system permease subunit